MRYGIVRLTTVIGMALTLGGCEDPFVPSDEQVVLAGRAGGASFTPTTKAISPAQIDVAWPDNSSNESGFEVHRSTQGSNGSFGLVGGTGANATTYSDVGLTPEKEYCYKVRPYRTSGRKTTYSAFSTTSCTTTPPSPPPPPPPPGPTAPSETAARPPGGYLSHTVQVTWADNSIDEQGFRVERSGSQDGPWEKVWSADPNNTLAYIYAQPYEQQLCYRVVAFKGMGESPSNVDCTALANGPTNLTATAVGSEAVDLAWSDNSAFEDGYEIERSETGGNPFALVATVEGNSTTFRDGTVSDNSTYWYRVAVKRDGGNSGLSATVTAVMASGAPSAPTDTKASASGSTSAIIEWVDNSSNETGFRVERSADHGGTWSVVGTANLNYPAFLDNELPSEAELCYRVLAFNSVGQSTASSDCTTLIRAPTDLVAIPIDDQTTEYRWDDNSSFEDNYELWFVGYDSNEGYEYYYFVELPGNTTSYRASTAESVYGVVGRNADGYSDFALLASGQLAASLPSRTSKALRPPRVQRTLPTPRMP